MANSFSEYFDNKIKTIRNDIDVERNIMNRVMDNCNHCMYHDPKLAAFEEITLDGLAMLLSSMNNKFSSLDPIPTWLFNASVDELNPVV